MENNYKLITEIDKQYGKLYFIFINDKNIDFINLFSKYTDISISKVSLSSKFFTSFGYDYSVIDKIFNDEQIKDLLMWYNRDENFFWNCELAQYEL